MPVLDGLAPCREMKADPALNTIPVIVLTARAQNAEREASLAAGADLVLVKPVSLRVLLDRIRGLSGGTESNHPVV